MKKNKKLGEFWNKCNTHTSRSCDFFRIIMLDKTKCVCSLRPILRSNAVADAVIVGNNVIAAIDISVKLMCSLLCYYE